MVLSEEQGRIIGSLIEKQLTTPQQYPLTLNALTLACNQTSNRDPVVNYAESIVSTTLDELREAHLVRFVLPSHGRSVIRYRQVLDEVFGLDAQRLAVIGELLLRGAQTPGQLRSRAERMASFDDLATVERELEALAEHENTLVARLGRQPGQKEERWRCLLVAQRPSDSVAPFERVEPVLRADPSSTPRSGDPSAELAEVHQELATIRAELSELRSELGQLRESLGG
jgi:uncharacterized protein YceH (UPF0502 family)